MKFRMRAGRKRYLDVWPVNFLTSEDTDVTDNTSLFLFQLACIVNMVSKHTGTSEPHYVVESCPESVQVFLSGLECD
jgi:hypothetical protein